MVWILILLLVSVSISGYYLVLLTLAYAGLQTIPIKRVNSTIAKKNKKKHQQNVMFILEYWLQDNCQNKTTDLKVKKKRSYYFGVKIEGRWGGTKYKRPKNLM